ncbi:PP2C family protein-serine/threonine phosphatase [Rubinisphaera brasiliensis]|nr:SpoIIE family protein phosphatase [Rubinisphaera brasiliensis]
MGLEQETVMFYGVQDRYDGERNRFDASASDALTGIANPSGIEEFGMSEQTWEERLETVYELMHEMSRQTEPQAMVRAYGKRVSKLFPANRRISLSRRDLEYPNFRITRYSEWDDDINPWQEKHRLPLLKGGLLAELIYSNRPHIIDEVELSPDDPAFQYLDGQRSLIAVPMLDGGEALNMVILAREQPAGFDREQFPETVWMSNLFGRATHNLVLKDESSRAFKSLDRELKMVSQIQQALLPKKMPDIKGFELSAYYRTSARAGGDYYDFFPLDEDLWGLLIADVSGHGTPAAVVMAITHSIAHLFPNQTDSPDELLEFVNNHLSRRYTNGIEAFVTAYYAVYNARTRTLRYASAGHHPPRLWKCAQQQIVPVEHEGSFPLGIFEDADYPVHEITLDPGDRLILYTDGITEAMSDNGEQFGTDRLDEVLTNSCPHNAPRLLQEIIEAVDKHTNNAPPADDRTLIVGTVR